MQSPLYDLAERVSVTFTPEPGTPAFDPVAQAMRFPEEDAGAVTVEAFLFPKGSERGTERPGLELGQSELIMQVVGTPDDEPLRLPEGVTAGRKGAVTLFGRKGTVELLPVSPPQIPEVSDENGWLYSVRFEATK